MWAIKKKKKSSGNLELKLLEKKNSLSIGIENIQEFNYKQTNRLIR